MSEYDSVDQKLQAGIEAARSGDRTKARRLLEQVIEVDDSNELAWIWLASSVNTVRERRDCLERVLQINPNNTRAREALSRLDPRESARPDDSARSTVDQVRRARQQPSPRREAPEARRGGINPLNLFLGLLVAVAVVAALVILSSLTGGGGDAVPTETLPPIVFVPTEPQFQIVPTATIASVPFTGTSGAPTLPPTFTATATPTLTPTATFTATQYPIAEFQALYVSLEDGSAEPDLYLIAGDGTRETRLGSRFRDVAFDSSAQRIAFVRDVEYPGDPDAGIEPFTAPELFVADVNNPNNAFQVTELRASILSSPTWSPESTELIFVSNYDGDEELWYVTPDGLNLWQVTDNDRIDREPAWSPVIGSREIAFVSDVGGLNQVEIYSIELSEPGVPLVYRQLTNSANSSYAPAWSPDGTKITFASDRRGSSEIYIMNADGSNEVRINTGERSAEYLAPVFTPDSERIAFVSNREDERFQVYAVSLIDGSVIRITNNNRHDLSIQYQPDLRLRLR